MAVESFDVLIIGSGAGGGTLAHRLALGGKRVLILERGEFLPREKENWSTEAVFLEDRYHTKEVWLDSRGKDLHPGTGYWVGGNTKVYGAALFRLRERDFEEVKHRGGLSPAWPVKYEAFEPYYTQAEKLFTVHGQSGLDPTEPWRSSEFPFPPISNEWPMQEIEESLKHLGLNPFPTPLGLKLNEADRSESRCIRCDTCDAYPCLVHAKSDADVDCIRPIRHKPNVRLVTGAKVTRIIHNASGTAIEAVEAEVRERNQVRPRRFQAALYALSAGAINSAALLLKSASDRYPAGLANSSGLVGRHFMFHQADTFLALTPGRKTANYLKTVSVNDFYFGEKDYPFPMGNVQPLGSVHAEMMKVDAPYVPMPVLELMAERAIPWWLTTEDLPDPENRVVLNHGRIQLLYKQNNVESFLRLQDRWIDVLKRAGHADQWFRLHAYLKKRVGLEGVGHQNGTCRFGTDPKQSVLDINCRAHDLDNLYVVDASFFPSCGAVNPALTVVANALRVGDHLLQRLGQRLGQSLGGNTS